MTKLTSVRVKTKNLTHSLPVHEISLLWTSGISRYFCATLQLQN